MVADELIAATDEALARLPSLGSCELNVAFMVGFIALYIRCSKRKASSRMGVIRDGVSEE